MSISALYFGSEITMRSIDPTLSSTSISGKVQTRKVSGQRWGATVKFSPLERDVSHFQDYFQRGQDGIFLLQLPFLPVNYVSNQGYGNYYVNGDHNAGDTYVYVDGLDFTPSRGDWVRINQKVYFVENFIGGTRIQVYPPLISDTADNSIVSVYPTMVCRLANDIQEFSYGTSRYPETEIEVIEHLY